MIKLSSVFMERTCSKRIKAISRGRRKLKRNRKQKGNRFANIVEINKLPDDLIVNILSRMSLKEAARTSVLAHRWRYLWRSVFGTLQFDFRDFVTAAGDVAEVEKFISWVNNVLEVHQGRYIEGMAVLFEGMHEEQYELTTRIDPAIHSWVFFAVQKQVERFDLRLSVNYKHEFPSIERLKSLSRGAASPYSRLRSLRLVEVRIRDEVVSYLLASCPYLEYLCIWWSFVTKTLRVVDPPSLKTLEIKVCHRVDCVEISAESLVSLSYTGRENDLVLKKIPNLRELTIGSSSFLYFIRVVKEHFNPFDKLVKLVVDLTSPSVMNPLIGLPDLPHFYFLKRLEVRVYSVVGRSLLYFTSLIEASPELCEFRIEMSYGAFLRASRRDMTLYPAISSAEAVKFDHRSLKFVEMAGYVGCLSENRLLQELLANASSIEQVFIDTSSGYYDDPELATLLVDLAYNEIEHFPQVGSTTRAQSKERAKNFVSTAPHNVKFIIA